jgi:hypothetical protein
MDHLAVNPFAIKQKGTGVYSYYVADLGNGKEVLGLTFLVLGSRHEALREETRFRFGSGKKILEGAGEVEISNGRVTRINEISSTLFLDNIKTDPDLVKRVFSRDLSRLGIVATDSEAFVPYDRDPKHILKEHFSPPHAEGVPVEKQETLGHFIKGKFAATALFLKNFGYQEYLATPAILHSNLQETFRNSDIIRSYLSLLAIADGVAETDFWDSLEGTIKQVISSDRVMSEADFSTIQEGIGLLGDLTSPFLNRFSSEQSEEEKSRRRILLVL